MVQVFHRLLSMIDLHRKIRLTIFNDVTPHNHIFFHIDLDESCTVEGVC
jgi:hypothetical protein